jgi:hypothetical protein
MDESIVERSKDTGNTEHLSVISNLSWG